MKRLLDETTDDLTRALLVAGIEQRPPAGNQAKLMLALGAGSALGLFSSNALAWLGSSGGKLSLLGVALGVAGAVYAVAPWEADTAPSMAPPGGPHARLVGDAVVEAVPSPGMPKPEATRGGYDPGKAIPEAAVSGAAVPGAAVSGAAVSGAAVSGAAVSGAAVSGAAVSGAAVSGAAVREMTAPDHADPGRVGAEPGAREPAVAGRAPGRVSPKSSEPRRDGPLPAVQAPPAVSASAEHTAEESSLDSEVRLVDDMHWAARRNDREALGRFLEAYRLRFPNGQLEKEVSEFAARLERPLKR